MSIAISSPTKNVKDKNCENKILKKLQEHLCVKGILNGIKYYL